MRHVVINPNMYNFLKAEICSPHFLWRKYMRYVIAIFTVFIAFSYWAGNRIATQKCDTRIAELNSQKNEAVFNSMEKINEKTFNTGVRDIRRILHEQYTIAE